MHVPRCVKLVLLAFFGGLGLVGVTAVLVIVSIAQAIITWLGDNDDDAAY